MSGCGCRQMHSEALLMLIFLAGVLQFIKEAEKTYVIGPRRQTENHCGSPEA